MNPLGAAEITRLESVATAFAAAFVDAPGGPPMAAARRRLLGPTTVWRTVRALTDRAGLGARIADLGLRVRPSGGTKERVWAIDASATGCVVACALAAWRSRDGDRATLAVGPRCDVEAARAALLPLLETGELELQGSEGGVRRTRAVVAPYFYSPGDLRRVAEALALERAVPSPHAEGDLEIYVARGWAQRHLFAERLNAATSALGAPTLVPSELDVDDATELLEKVRHLPASDAIAAFVYPMLRERPEVERALLPVLSASEIAVVNQTPAIAWALGRAALLAAVVVEADQRMRGVASPRAMSRRAVFEASPSVGRAMATLAWGWVG